jgi:hypothetical protein
MFSIKISSFQNLTLIIDISARYIGFEICYAI